MDYATAVEKFIAAYDTWLFGTRAAILSEEFKTMMLARRNVRLADIAYWEQNEQAVTHNEARK